MKENFIYSSIFKLIYQLVIIVLGLICFISPILKNHTFLNDTAYFTNLSNFANFGFSLFLSINLIINLFNKKTNYLNKLPFTIIWLCFTHIITVTFFIFCFILFPLSILFDPSQITPFLNYNTITIHIIIPLLSICYFLLYSEKKLLEYNDSFFCLIIPSFYYLYVIIRVMINDTNLLGTQSPYPYFFFNANYNNQGYVAVIIYIFILVIFFYLIALFLIFLYKTIYKKTS